MEGRFNGGFLALRVGGAYIWRGLYMEGLIFGILRYVCLWNPESGKFRNLGFEMWNTAQGIRNPTNSWNLQLEIC